MPKQNGTSNLIWSSREIPDEISQPITSAAGHIAEGVKDNLGLGLGAGGAAAVANQLANRAMPNIATSKPVVGPGMLRAAAKIVGPWRTPAAGAAVSSLTHGRSAIAGILQNLANVASRAKTPIQAGAGNTLKWLGAGAVGGAGYGAYKGYQNAEKARTEAMDTIQTRPVVKWSSARDFGRLAGYKLAADVTADAPAAKERRPLNQINGNDIVGGATFGWLGNRIGAHVPVQNPAASSYASQGMHSSIPNIGKILALNSKRMPPVTNDPKAKLIGTILGALGGVGVSKGVDALGG